MKEENCFARLWNSSDPSLNCRYFCTRSVVFYRIVRMISRSISNSVSVTLMTPLMDILKNSLSIAMNTTPSSGTAVNNYAQ